MKRMHIKYNILFSFAFILSFFFLEVFFIVLSHLESMRKTVDLSLTTCCCTMTSVWRLLRRVSSCDSERSE